MSATASPNDMVQQAGTRDNAQTIMQGMTSRQVMEVADLNYVDIEGCRKSIAIHMILNYCYPATGDDN